jgi:small subunit ribosomal protein S11
MAKVNTKVKKKKKIEAIGKVYVTTSFNNIIVSVTDLAGNVVSWSSAGKMKFRGSKKNTPYAAQLASTDCVKSAYDLGLRKVEVFVRGTGSGREAAMRAIGTSGVEVTQITDITPLPHNGCRPPKKRRV